MKQQATVWEKILANHISEKGLVLKIKKNSKSSKVKKKNNPITKWAKDMHRHFTEEDIERCSNQPLGKCKLRSR